MKARSIIAGAAYDPDQIRLINQAFDQVWENWRRDQDPQSVDEVRADLAKAVLAAAARDCSSVEAIISGALQEFDQRSERRSPKQPAD